MPSTPPLPTNADIPSTPPTSPQRYQQAARDQERNQRLIGSPEQRRTPANSSHPPAPPPVIVSGCELHHLPLGIRMQMADIPSHPPPLQRRGGASVQPFPFSPPFSPLPPPPPPFLASAFASGSVAPPILGPGFALSLPPPPPPLP